MNISEFLAIMECVSSMPRTSLGVSSPIIHQCAASGLIQGSQHWPEESFKAALSGGLIQGSQRWTVESFNATLFDCISQWTFGKGTAASNGDQPYLESPPVSPRSGPTQMATSIPALTLREEEDDFSLDGDRIDTACIQRDKELCEDLGSRQTNLSLSSASIGTPKAPDEEHPCSVRQFQLDCLCIFEGIKNDSAGDSSWIVPKLTLPLQSSESTGALQRPHTPTEFRPLLDDRTDEDTNSSFNNIAQPISPQPCIQSVLKSSALGSTAEEQSQHLPGYEASQVQYHPRSVSSPSYNRSTPEPKYDEESTLVSRNSGAHQNSRVKKPGRRDLWSPLRTARENAKDLRQERRQRVEKSRRQIMTKLHPRLHRSRSSDSNTSPEPSRFIDQPESTQAIRKDRKATSISGPVMNALLSSSDSPRGPPVMADEQTAAEEGLSSGESSTDQSATESSSYCDETEGDVSDFEQPHPLDNQRDDILSILLEKYDSYRTEFQQNNPGPSSNDTGPNRQGSHAQPNSNTSSGKRSAGQKRKAGFEENNDDEYDDNTGPRKKKRPKMAEEETTENQSFACPFSKKSPSIYRRCYRYELKRVRDVKQHLRRCHRKAVYCPVCSQTFSTEEARDTHVRQRNCPENPRMPVEGISDVQAQKLAARCSSKESPEQQWFRVFDICFPGLPRPRSPYVDRLLSEELQSFRDYASAEGPSIMMEHLRGAHIWNDQDAAFLRRMLSEGLEHIADRWSESLVPCQDPEQDGTSSDTLTRPTSPHAPKSTRDCRAEDVATSASATAQPQIFDLSSGGDQPSEALSQAGNSIFEIGVELFDFSMLPAEVQTTAGTGEVDFHPDLWSLQYGPNREVTI